MRTLLVVDRREGDHQVAEIVGALANRGSVDVFSVGGTGSVSSFSTIDAVEHHLVWTDARRRGHDPEMVRDLTSLASFTRPSMVVGTSTAVDELVRAAASTTGATTAIVENVGGLPAPDTAAPASGPPDAGGLDPSRAPNVFLVGSAKAGTSSLARYLAQHPSVFLPRLKEPNYHAVRRGGPNCTGPVEPERLRAMIHRFSFANPADYADLYAEAAGHPARMDASVRYAYEPTAIPSIAADAPDARIIFVLRDPVERMQSHWRMNRQRQLESLEFRAALDAEDERVAAGWDYDWHYRRVSTLAPQLERIHLAFPSAQVLVLFYGDLARRADEVVRRCFSFLDVDPSFDVDTSARARVPSSPRHQRIDRVVNWPGPVRDGLDRLPMKLGRKVRQRITNWNAAEPERVVHDTAGLQPSFDPDRASLAAMLHIDEDELRRRMAGASTAD